MLASTRRMYHIARVLIRYRLHEYLPDEGAFRWLRHLARLHPAYYQDDGEAASLGKRLRLALQDLGPIFVKLGQTLSTRPDLLSPDLLAELSQLQDKVPPFPGAEAPSLPPLTRARSPPLPSPKSTRQPYKAAKTSSSKSCAPASKKPLPPTSR